MALGDAGRDYGIPYYSRFNLTSEDRKTRMSVNFKGGLLNLNIGESTCSDYRYDAKIFISLSQKKAIILKHLIEMYVKDKIAGVLQEEVAYTVDTGIKDVRPTIGMLYRNGKDNIVMGRINPSGEHEIEYLFPINSQYHYGIKWSDYANNEFSKEYFDDAEIELFSKLLDEFINSSFGAYAASTWDMVGVDPKGYKSILEAVGTKFGIEMRSKNSSAPAGNGNSFFNNDSSTPAKGNGPRHTSLEEMEGLE